MADFILIGSMVSCCVVNISKYEWGVQPVHSILTAAIVLIVSLISIATFVSRPIPILFGSMVSCCVVNVSKYVCGVQPVHSILMAAIVLTVSLISIETIVLHLIIFFLVPWSI